MHKLTDILDNINVLIIQRQRELQYYSNTITQCQCILLRLINNTAFKFYVQSEEVTEEEFWTDVHFMQTLS